jgi:glycogen synthase
MRILFISNYYPPYEVGGYEQMCRDVAVGMTARGHAVHVLTSNHRVTAGRVDPEPGISRTLELTPASGSSLSMAAQFWLKRRRVEAKNLSAFYAARTQFRPEVVFIWNLQSLPRSLATEAESLEGAAAAYWLAGYSPAEPDEYWQYWSRPPKVRGYLAYGKQALAGRALHLLRAEGKPARPAMRHVSVVSEYARARGISEGVLPDHAEVIYNGIDCDQFYRPAPRSTDGSLNILIAGRVTPDKGVHLAIQALARLAESNRAGQVHLSIAGAGPAQYLRQLQVLIRESGLQPQVSLLGKMPREEVPAVMFRHEVLLLPNLHAEAFARAVLEAMAAGLAVVAADNGGTAEIVEHDATGLLCRAGDVDDLARQIARVVEEPGLRHRLATAGQKVVRERFSLERMLDKIEAFLEQAWKSQ